MNRTCRVVWLSSVAVHSKWEYRDLLFTSIARISWKPNRVRTLNSSPNCNFTFAWIASCKPNGFFWIESVIEWVNFFRRNSDSHYLISSTSRPILPTQCVCQESLAPKPEEHQSCCSLSGHDGKATIRYNFLCRNELPSNFLMKICSQVMLGLFSC